MFNGKKTYLTALVSVLGTVAAALSGQISWPDAAQIIVTAALATTVRHGVGSAPPAQK